MEPISVTARSGAPADTDADTRVVGLFEGDTLDEPELQALVDAGEAKGGLRKLALTHEDSPGGRRRVIVAGLGKPGEFDPERARVAAATAAKRAGELGTRSLSWAAPVA
ncbi:MAG TPA: M17 family peptidase N-terminal domain-containing protein, partial [Thermoleophilaceae bacterium]|nr:M17 family peptidase N-terminal domain-containing protein [Thermoleophilaceae bacterium]